jgi:hypothetical protein
VHEDGVKTPSSPDQKDGLEDALHPADDGADRGQGVNCVTHKVFDLEASRLVAEVGRICAENDDVINVFIDSLKLATQKTCCSVKHRLRLTLLMGGWGGESRTRSAGP